MQFKALSGRLNLDQMWGRIKYHVFFQNIFGSVYPQSYVLDMSAVCVNYQANNKDSNMCLGNMGDVQKY